MTSYFRTLIGPRQSRPHAVTHSVTVRVSKQQPVQRMTVTGIALKRVPAAQAYSGVLRLSAGE